MNAADVGMNGEASASNGEQNRETISNCPKNNDCGKHCTIGVGGARPKARNLVCNIPNGFGSHLSDDAAKVNNNVLPPTDVNDPVASGSGTISASNLQNGLNLNCTNSVESTNGIDSYLQNNVNYHANVDKCPMKVRSCSNTDNGIELSAKSNGYCQESQHGGVTRRWDDDSSSDTANEGEDGQSADECCFYTYKGDQMADLPSSFYTHDVLARGDQSGEGGRREDGDDEGRVGNRNGGGSSPEMDFLEMDFDPGPSCEQDSEDDSDCCDMQVEEADVYGDHEVENHQPEPLLEAENHNDLGAISLSEAAGQLNSCSCTPEEPKTSPQQPSWSLSCSRSADANLGAGTSGISTHRAPGCLKIYCAVEDLSSPEDASEVDSESLFLWNVNSLQLQTEGGATDAKQHSFHLALYRALMDKQAFFIKIEDGEIRSTSAAERRLTLFEMEYSSQHMLQVSTPSCEFGAVSNVLFALKVPFCIDVVQEAVKCRLPSNSAPLPEYLFSRSVAGASHVEIIRALEIASDGAVYARFFPMYPERNMSLRRWLSHWMKKGAVPIAAMNLQGGKAEPDAWRHQMIFGVSPNNIFFASPIQIISEEIVWRQLSSPSAVMVRRDDIMSRWNEHTSLRPLMNHPDSRWKKMNVLGQVVNVIRESVCTRSQTQGWTPTQYVSVPSVYSSGITLVIRRDSPAYEELRTAPELPFLQQQHQGKFR